MVDECGVCNGDGVDSDDDGLCDGSDLDDDGLCDVDQDGNCDAGDGTPGGEVTFSFSNGTETSIDLDYSSDVDLVGNQFVVTGVDGAAIRVVDGLVRAGHRHDDAADHL